MGKLDFSRQEHMVLYLATRHVVRYRMAPPQTLYFANA